MLASVWSATVIGVNGELVRVEADIGRGLPSFDIVGLPDTSVMEARDRVRSALRNAGFDFPLARITVNLAPAQLPKGGAGFDLPIAMTVLAASNQIKDDNCDSWLFMGELGLDGSARFTPGTLPATLAAREKGLKCVVVPPANAAECHLVPGIAVAPLGHLRDLPQLLDQISDGSFPKAGGRGREHHQLPRRPSSGTDLILDLVVGQESAKRGLEVAAAGGHNLLMCGPPGVGKTLLARCIAQLLPGLEEEQVLEVTRIYSAAGILAPGRLIQSRPFRAPHHSCTRAGMVGGGTVPVPGEVTLAHRGVLFLDELGEYSREILELLRAPMEDKCITVSRSRISVTFPADFMLVAAMNPCPCGYYGSDASEGGQVCKCRDGDIRRYHRRVSGPIIDRFDLFLWVDRPHSSNLEPGANKVAVRGGEGQGSRQGQVADRVAAARAVQLHRFRSEPIYTNSEMGRVHFDRYCQLSPKGRGLLGQAYRSLGLSMRAHDRIIKLGRTIADLDGSQRIDANHIGEAIQYRERPHHLL